MLKMYDGPIKLKEFKAVINVENDDAEVTSSYTLYNESKLDTSVKASSLKSDLSKFQLRSTKLPNIRDIKRLRYNQLIAKETLLQLKPFQQEIIDADFNIRVESNTSKALQFFPEIDLDKQDVLHQVQNFDVTIQLPQTAKRVINSNLKPSLIQKNSGRINSLYKYSNQYLMPILLKWTEIDIDIDIKKSAKILKDNILEVTLTIKNNQSKRWDDITIEDNYSAGSVGKLADERHVTVEFPPNKAPRVVHKQSISLLPNESKTIIHRIQIKSIEFVLPDTSISYKKDLVGLGILKSIFKFPIPLVLHKTAFVLPSGFSFDYMHGGDHHLNEIGAFCNGINYTHGNQRLRWSTGVMYADKNFDDDYRWSVNHQIVKFDPGFSHFAQTPWIMKSGNISSHNGSFQHEALKQFPNAVVLLAGWRFDFTSEDHHINVVSINIEHIVFDKANGKINWSTKVSYADKNFDDNYRYQYSYIILAYQGDYRFKSFQGTDNGGSALKKEEITDNAFKNYRNAMVLPLGWSFDFTKDDHHINEMSFRLSNVQYTPSLGKVSWDANLNYSDQNFDDPYKWTYRVIILVTNSGQCADYTVGPYTDDGGGDVKHFNVDLNVVFRPITWNNGIMDGDETGVDCGGSSPARNIAIISNSINPGNAASADLFSLKNINDQIVIKTFAKNALYEYAIEKNQNFNTFYSGPHKPDRYVEAVAAYVDKYMEYVKDGGSFNGSQTALTTLTKTGHRGSGFFNGDCEDHAILRAALLRALGFPHQAIFCADHHNTRDQGQHEECNDSNKKAGGHTFNIVIYKGKYRILDYGRMQPRYWANKRAWDQHVVDNIWNDHTGKHWSEQDVSPYNSSHPMVNYPGNHIHPTSNWDWRTYFNDVTL